VDRIYHIDCGYETIEEKLAQLGAVIRRIPSRTPTALPVGLAATPVGAARPA